MIENFKIDIIIPTASTVLWPASESIPHTKSTIPSKYDIRILPIVSNGPSFSFAKSVNRGFDEARPDAHVLLLNDDCFLDPNWIPRFRSAILSHPESGIFGALLRFPQTDQGNPLSGRKALNHFDPEYQHAGGFIPQTKTEILKSLARFIVWHRAPLWVLRMVTSGGIRFPGHYHNLNPKNKIHLITAAAMLITPEARYVLGGFDERYPLAFEDTDYCLRALEYGFVPCLVSNATGTHYESLTTRHLESKKRTSFRIFREAWPITRIKTATSRIRGIVHPLRCTEGDWVE